MRIYLAARYVLRHNMRNVAAELETDGHTVTSRWLYTDHPYDMDDPSCHALLTDWALRDEDDVREADTLVAFCEGPGGGKGGRHVELGMALALGKVVCVVGQREHIFHCHPAVRFFATWLECRGWLAGRELGG